MSVPLRNVTVRVLAILAADPSRSWSVLDLARETGASKQTVARIVRAAEAGGLALAGPDPRHSQRRRYRFALAAHRPGDGE